ncbi:hypothetical protein QQP08_016440 [Theobroma cacao]|nr:hypothetical protein QQP08_016440 [Theobroma cacao]
MTVKSNGQQKGDTVYRSTKSRQGWLTHLPRAGRTFLLRIDLTLASSPEPNRSGQPALYKGPSSIFFASKLKLLRIRNPRDK